MDSKKQSKLPPGIGSKIVKALKTQTPQSEMQKAQPEEVPPMPQETQPIADAHGLETKSHMDFGSQEMYYDEVPGPLEPTDIPDLETINSYNEVPQYGSFEIPEDEPASTSEDDFSAITEYDQQSYQEESYDPDPFEITEYDQQSYETVGFEQQTPEIPGFEESTQDDFDYDQQTYEDFGSEFETEEIEEYQAPQLGEPLQTGYQVADHQPEMEEIAQPSQDQFETDMNAYEPIEEETNYTDYSDEASYEADPAQANSYEDYSDYNQQSYEEQTDYASYEPPQQQIEPEYQELHEVQPLESTEQIQIGYSQEDLEGEYRQPIYQEDYQSVEPPTALDLDAVDTPANNDYIQEPIYHEPQTPVHTPLDIDSYSQQPSLEEPQEATPPVMPEAPEETYTYQEPARRDVPVETYSYQEPAKEYRPMEERIYQEPPREYYKPQEQTYREPPREYYKPQEPEYREPPREYYKPQEPLYREPPREYYKPQEQTYREPMKEMSYERAYAPETRRPRHEETLSPRVADLLNPNVETLIKLVSTLPHGVTKQTGAQIIKQTMEAMGISMNEVLTDAQGAQAHMQKHMNDCYDKIEESKRIIRQLDDDIYNYQRKTKELNDLMSLFIYPDNDIRRR